MPHTEHPALPPFAAMLNDVLAPAGALLRRQFSEIRQHIASREQCEAIASKAEATVLRRLQSSLIAAMSRRGYAAESIGFVLEDTAELPNTKHLFIIDPLDGWLNYTAGLPIYAAGIAYVYRGQIQASAIVQPEMQRTYAAQRGSGAYLLAPHRPVERLHAVPLPLGQCMCDVPASPPHTIRGLLLHGVHNVSPNARAMRMIGSSLYGLCCIADNSLQVVCRRFRLCDIAPGLVLLQEAGAVAVDIDGIPLVLSLQYPQRRWLGMISHPDLAAELLYTFHSTNHHHV